MTAFGFLLLSCDENNDGAKSKICTDIYVHSVKVFVQGLDEEKAKELTIILQDAEDLTEYPVNYFSDYYLSNYNGVGEMNLKIFFGENLLVEESLQIEIDDAQCHAIQQVLAYNCLTNDNDEVVSCEKVLNEN